MKLAITLEVDMENPPRNDEFALLLRDALGEFISIRTPADAYLRKRYGDEGHTDHFMIDKVQEICRRRGWADALYSASSNVKVEIK